jgi:arabinofuranosyltransferase
MDRTAIEPIGPSAAAAGGAAVASGLLAAGAAAVLGWSVVATAWLGDDAFISLRTIDNWLGGHGLRWNVAERTQTFTHPLWLLLVAAAALLGGPGYGTLITVSLAVSTAVVSAVAALAGRWAGAGAVLLLLAHLRCVVDYSSSGLENPLTHLLVAALAFTWLRVPDAARRCRWCALLTGLCLCNRIDLLWLCLPVLFGAARSAGLVRSLPALAIGLLPFAGWALFATYYYGTPLPLSAYAKAIAAGIAALELAVQGCRYVADFALRDPAAAATLTTAFAFCFVRSGRRARPLLLGAVLYVVYVVKVGGDFMGGRFFSAPTVLSVCVLADLTRTWSAGHRWLCAFALSALAFLPGLPRYVPAWPEPGAPDPTLRWGIGDEQQVYAGMLGLLSPRRVAPEPGLPMAMPLAAGDSRPVIWVDPFIGVRGYVAGPEVHLVDPLLCDPLLARLPNPPLQSWRIGHVRRRIPEGYLESLASGENRIHHPGLRRYWAALRAIIRAPLSARERLELGVAFLAGRFDADLRDYLATDYRNPPTPTVPAAELDRQVAEGTPWYRCAARVIHDGGLDVVFAEPVRAPQLLLALDAADHYRLQFRAGDRLLHETALASARLPHGGVESHTLAVPAAAVGFDRLRILAEPGGDFVAAVAAVRLGR